MGTHPGIYWLADMPPGEGPWEIGAFKGWVVWASKSTGHMWRLDVDPDMSGARWVEVDEAMAKKPRKVGVRPVRKRIAGGDLKARERAFKARTGRGKR